MQKFRVYFDYSPVRLLPLDEVTDPGQEAAKAGLEGSFRTVAKSDLPSSKQDRDCWDFDRESGKVVVNPQKLQAKTKKAAQLQELIAKADSFLEQMEQLESYWENLTPEKKSALFRLNIKYQIALKKIEKLKN